MKISGILARWLLPVGYIFVVAFFVPGSWLPFSQGKWIANYLIGVVALALMVQRGLRWPAWPRWLSIGTLVVIALGFAKIYWHWPISYDFVVLERASFLLLILYAWYAFQQKLVTWDDFWWPLAITLFCLSAVGLWQFWKVGFPGEMPYTRVAASFGHSNNAAQFLGLSLLFWWFFVKGDRFAERYWWIQPLVSAQAIAYFLLLRSRSALAGFALSLALAAFLRYRGSGRARLPWRTVGIAAALGLVIFCAMQLVGGKRPSDLLRLTILAEKSSLTTYRGDVWKQTLRMIGFNPLGVGPGKFELAFIPFHRLGPTFSENALAGNPHSEPLRIVAEEGIPLAFLFFLTFGYLFWRGWMGLDAEWRRRLLSIAPFLAIEFTGQFLTMNPGPCFLLATLIGFLLYRGWPEGHGVPVRWRKGAIAGGAVLCVLLGAMTARASISRFFEHPRDIEMARLSCELMPLNWRSCLHLARMESDQKNYVKARQVLERLHYTEPMNFAAIRSLSLVAFSQGEALEGCFLLWRYDMIFHGNSSLHDKLKPNCKEKWLDYFERKKPSKYYPAFQRYEQRKKNDSVFSGW